MRVMAPSATSTNDTFSLEIKPNIGSVVTLERDVPLKLDPVMDLR